MPSSEDDRTVTGWRTESRFYRRKPGAGWLWAFLAIPLLLAAIGWGGLAGAGKSDQLAVPTVAPSATMSVPSTTASAPSVEASAELAPMSIVRNGNGFTLTGELPDEKTKADLLDAIRGALPGATIVDELTVKAGVQGPDAAGLGSLFGASLAIPDFNLQFDGKTVTLTGTAPDEATKADAESAAKATWPNVQVVNNIEVNAATSTGAAPPPPAPPAPAPGPSGGACATLQTDITALLKTPINFITNGFVLAPESRQLIQQIADKVKGCPDAKLSVVGHTDNTGNDAINTPLSASRAKSVADELVSDGIAEGSVTSSGAGSANPIASNATPDGRAQNRRVEITVS